MAKRPSPEAKNGADLDTNPRPRRIRLGSMIEVRRELARLYAEARAGEVATQDASRLANMLMILGRLIEGSDFERRLAELEKVAGRPEGPAW